MPKSKTRKPTRRVKPTAEERAARRAARTARAERAITTIVNAYPDRGHDAILHGLGGPTPPPAAGASAYGRHAAAMMPTHIQGVPINEVIVNPTSQPQLDVYGMDFGATVAHLERFRVHGDIISRERY